MKTEKGTSEFVESKGTTCAIDLAHRCGCRVLTRMVNVHLEYGEMLWILTPVPDRPKMYRWRLHAKNTLIASEGVLSTPTRYLDIYAVQYRESINPGTGPSKPGERLLEVGQMWASKASGVEYEITKIESKIGSGEVHMMCSTGDWLQYCSASLMGHFVLCGTCGILEARKRAVRNGCDLFTKENPVQMNAGDVIWYYSDVKRGWWPRHPQNLNYLRSDVYARQPRGALDPNAITSIGEPEQQEIKIGQVWGRKTEDGTMCILDHGHYAYAHTWRVQINNCKPHFLREDEIRKHWRLIEHPIDDTVNKHLMQPNKLLDKRAYSLGLQRYDEPLLGVETDAHLLARCNVKEGRMAYFEELDKPKPRVCKINDPAIKEIAKIYGSFDNFVQNISDLNKVSGVAKLPDYRPGPQIYCDGDE